MYYGNERRECLILCGTERGRIGEDFTEEDPYVASQSDTVDMSRQMVIGNTLWREKNVYKVMEEDFV